MTVETRGAGVGIPAAAGSDGNLPSECLAIHSPVSKLERYLRAVTTAALEREGNVIHNETVASFPSYASMDSEGETARVI